MEEVLWRNSTKINFEKILHVSQNSNFERKCQKNVYIKFKKFKNSIFIAFSPSITEESEKFLTTRASGPHQNLK